MYDKKCPNFWKTTVGCVLAIFHVFVVFCKSRWRNSHETTLRGASLGQANHQQTCELHYLLYSCMLYFGKNHFPGVDAVLANWAKMPRVLFAKAWVTTGHVSKETMMRVAQIDEAEWQSCNLQGDGSGLLTHLGPLATDEPSIEELIQNGANKRKRVVWTISSSSSEEPSALLPGSLLWPLERRLSSFLFARATGGETGRVRTWSTIVISRRAGREVSNDLLRRRTTLHADGKRSFLDDVSNRTLKDSFTIQCGCTIEIAV